MATSIGKLSKSFFLKLLVGIIILPFVFWGMGDVFRGGSQNVIATVDSEKISTQDIFEAFSNKDLNIFDDSKKLEKFIKSFHFKNTNLLMMSSGNFDNINIENLIDR